MQEIPQAFEKVSDLEKKIKMISRLAEKLQISGAVLGYFGQELFSLDAASLFTLVQEKNEKKLVKLGWGEFCKDTFVAPVEKAIYPYTSENGKLEAIERLNELRNIPAPLYCVRQHDSYLSDEDTRALMSSDPKEYLAKKALFVYNNGEVTANPLIAHLDKQQKQKEFLVSSANVDEVIKYLEEI